MDINWTIVKDVGAWLASTGILGALIWYLQHKITRREDERDRKRAEEVAADKTAREKRQKEVDDRDKKRQKEQDAREERRDALLLNLMASSDAALELAEATARAVQRIPDAHCNGDMHAALERAAEVRKSKNEFLSKTTIESIHDGEE